MGNKLRYCGQLSQGSEKVPVRIPVNPACWVAVEPSVCYVLFFFLLDGRILLREQIHQKGLQESGHNQCASLILVISNF